MLPRVFAPCLFALFVGTSCGSSESVEVAEPDAGPPTETVTVILGPEYPGVLVFSSEPDGALIASSNTGENGKAVLLARDGGMVSFSLYGSDLTTFLGVDTTRDILWQMDSQPLVGGQTISVDVPPLDGGRSYEVFACRDRAREQEAPVSVELRVQQDCLEDATYSVFGFASDNRDLVTYAHAQVDSAAGLEGPLALEWLSDFEEYPAELIYPGLTDFLFASPVLQYGTTRVRVPEHGIDLHDLLFRRPPGEPQELWTELTAYGPERGWQEFKGGLPTDTKDWLRVPAGAVINHSGAVAPELRWIPTNEGDHLSGFYLWDTGERFGSWNFVGVPEERVAVFPALPEALRSSMPLGVAPEFAVFFIDYFDYKDLTGYEEVMSAGRMPWSYARSLAEDFLRDGGSVASATTSAIISNPSSVFSIAGRPCCARQPEAHELRSLRGDQARRQGGLLLRWDRVD